MPRKRLAVNRDKGKDDVPDASAKLQKIVENKRFTPELFVLQCAKFFKKKQDLFYKVLTKVDDGKFMERVVRELFQEQQKLNVDPTRAVKAVLDFEIPISRYRRFVALNKYQLGDSVHWTRPTIYNVPVPKSWCGNNKFL